MIILPGKLSASQLIYLDKLAPKNRSLNEPGKGSTLVRQSSSKTLEKSSQSLARDTFAVDSRVQLARNVPDTRYRAGQQGTIIALHGMPPKVAEVEIDDTLYSDVVKLSDLLALS